MINVKCEPLPHEPAKNDIINSAVVIPALNPFPNLVALVEQLLSKGIPQVIVVNDGSSESYDHIFQQLKKYKGCTLLIHEKNYGKGKALKTAFNFFLTNFPYLDGVVTADADGQHTVDDIVSVCNKLSDNRNSIILGMRDFKDKSVPIRSYMGNRITSTVFRIFYGSYIDDTQTGLRGIPADILPWFATMRGDRYEYEINMLITSKKRNIPISSVPISTLYFDNNSGTHFSTIRDSSRIFLCILSGFIAYSFSGLISGLFDILVFFLLDSFVLSLISSARRLLFSTVIARISSSILNFNINKKLFSAETKNLKVMLLRYYSLWFLQLLSSFGLVYSAALIFEVHDTVLKICTDTILGMISYQIQLRWVFSNKDIGIEIN